MKVRWSIVYSQNHLNIYSFILFVILALLIRGEAYAQWEPTAFVNDRPAFLTISGNALYSSGENTGGVILSTDNGLSWSAQIDQRGHNVYEFFKCTALAESNNFLIGAIFGKSSWDSVNSWRMMQYHNNKWIYVGSPGLAEILTLLQTIDGYVYGCAIGSKLYQSDNSGSSFTNITNGMIGEVRKVASDGKYLYAATYNGGGVYRSSNLGASWDYFNNEMKGTAITDCIATGTSLFVASNGIWRSDDNAEHWTRILNDTTVTSITISGSTIFVGGEKFYLSADSGRSWQNISGELSGHRVRFISVNDKYLFAGLDSGLWRRPLRDFPSSVTNPPTAYEEQLLINSENQRLSIKFFSHAAQTLAKLEIYDLLGRLALSKNISNVLQGWNSIVSEWPTLPSGSCVVRISAHGYAQSKIIHIVR